MGKTGPVKINSGAGVKTVVEKPIKSIGELRQVKKPIEDIEKQREARKRYVELTGNLGNFIQKK